MIKKILKAALLTFIFSSCGNSSQEETVVISQLPQSLFEQAKKKSQEIINDIGTENFLTHFRNNGHFSDLVNPKYVHGKLKECGVEPAKLKYFDYFEEIFHDTTNRQVIDFFYEGPCTCPDIRIMITMIIDNKRKNIEFARFHAEPVAKPSDLIDNINKRNAEAKQ